MSDDEFEQDLLSLAIHEAGHFYAALELGIPATLEINVRADFTLENAWCFRQFSKSSFETAVSAWSGLSAEHVCCSVNRHRTPLLFPLTEEFLEAWHSEAMFHLHELSDSDRRHIVGYPHTLESLRHSVRIVLRHKAAIEKAAVLLADRTRKEIAEMRDAQAAKVAREWKGIAKPATFPASFDEFLQTVVSQNGSSTETFTEYLTADAATFLRWRGWHDHGVNPTDQPDGETVTRQVADDLAKLRREGFPTPESWLATARSFRSWQQQHAAKS